MSVTLTMTAQQHHHLQAHLFPGDGMEAAAVLLCGRRAGGARHRLLVHQIIHVPHDRCQRAADALVWPTDILDQHLDRAEGDNLAIVKIHSHPGGYDKFSQQDDVADRDLFPSVYGWVDQPGPHGSAIMLPDGKVLGRVVDESGSFHPFEMVAKIGDELTFWYTHEKPIDLPAAQRFAQMFGTATLAALNRLKIGIVGCSGTGTLVIEALFRSGAGHLLLVDPQPVEVLNLNRMLNTKMKHDGRLKVDVISEAINATELGATVTTVAQDLLDPEVVKAIAECDVVFGCVDNIETRHVLNRIAAFYLVPLFDVGVRISADGTGGVDGVEAGANYVAPDGASLMSRGMYTQAQLDAAMLERLDPEEYDRQRREGYVGGVAENQSAVMPVNMMAVALGLNDFLARLHPYRDADNAGFARQIMSLYIGMYLAEPLTEPDLELGRWVGRGDTRLLLEMPMFSEAER